MILHLKFVTIGLSLKVLSIQNVQIILFLLLGIITANENTFLLFWQLRPFQSCVSADQCFGVIGCPASCVDFVGNRSVELKSLQFVELDLSDVVLFFSVKDVEVEFIAIVEFENI